MRKLKLYRPSWICHVLFPILLIISLGSLAAAQSVDINDTRLLAQPAISKTHVTFIYAADLWAADLDGKTGLQPYLAGLSGEESVSKFFSLSHRERG